jgi:plastocyanin
MRRLSCVAALVTVLSSLALVSPAAAGGGCHTEEMSNGVGGQVDVGKNCFFPTVLRVDPGTTVTWRSFDPVEHNVTSAGGLISETLAAGAAYDFRFTKAGIYPYYCSLHPGMAGAVVVGDQSPVAAPVTAAEPVASTRTDQGVPGGAAAAIALVAAGSGFGLGLLRRRAEDV